MPTRKQNLDPAKLMVSLLVLVNAILIEEAYTRRQELYWVLLISGPLLVWSIVKLKRKTASKRLNLKKYLSFWE